MPTQLLRKAGPGRPPGCQNKITASAKRMMQEVHEGMGGVKGMLAWALDHPTEFYKLYVVKMIPNAVKVQGDPKKPLRHVHELTEEQLVRIASGGG